MIIHLYTLLLIVLQEASGEVEQQMISRYKCDSHLLRAGEDPRLTCGYRRSERELDGPASLISCTWKKAPTIAR